MNSLLRHGESTVPPGFFHVLATASTPEINLCKTIISATLAGYPAPILVNWDRPFRENHDNPHVARILGVHEYLQGLDSSRDDDLVLVVDGYDIWFQLGPQVLIDRYFELNRQADARIKKRLGSKAVEDLKIHQRIIFSAQKACWPGGAEDLNCYAVPNSTLPQDVYGPETDQLINDSDNPSLRVRQRFLSSGIAMGPLAEMRRFYGSAAAKYKDAPKMSSDQSIFARMHGEQEYQREVIRLRYMSGASGFSTWLGQHAYMQDEAPSILEPHPTRRKMEPAEGAPFDFGLGLDYTSTLGQATVFAEHDSDWIVFNETASIIQAKTQNNISNATVPQISSDVSFSLPPFWTTTRLQLPLLPIQSSWSKVKLYTNLYTGITPAIIHHNAYKNNLKFLREAVWDRMWFQPYIRDLLRARLHEPYLPVAVTGSRGSEKSWWGPVEKRSLGLGAQPADPSKNWIHWDTLAQDGWAQELFRDGLGPWKEAG